MLSQACLTLHYGPELLCIFLQSRTNLLAALACNFATRASSLARSLGLGRLGPWGRRTTVARKIHKIHRPIFKILKIHRPIFKILVLVILPLLGTILKHFSIKSMVVRNIIIIIIIILVSSVQTLMNPIGTKLVIQLKVMLWWLRVSAQCLLQRVLHITVTCAATPGNHFLARVVFSPYPPFPTIPYYDNCVV